MKRVSFILAVLTAAIIACGPLATAGGEPTAVEQEPTGIPEPTSTPLVFTDATSTAQDGPVVINGSLSYSAPFFTDGVAQPVIILEDQTGFIDRDEDYIFPTSSQTLGQITSDFYTSPFTYTLALPIAPQGTLRDVDNDAEEETGVMVFAVAYWNNVWNDPYLERRDLYGGGWSGAYASTVVDEVNGEEGEIVGGKLVVYAPDDEQSFPSGFGEDEFLFTEDDPIMDLPAGWSVIDLDQDPFAIIRDAAVSIDLLEPEDAALEDYSDLGYLEAYEAMLELMSTEYSFTEYKNVDWEALDAEFRPRFEQADQRRSPREYALALRDLLWRIPDGHIGFSFNDELISAFQEEAIASPGIVPVELADGRVLVEYVLPDSPAAGEGIQAGAELIAVNGQPIGEAASDVVPWFGPYSTEHNRRLGQIQFVLRFPPGARVELTYANPGESEETATLDTVLETDTLFYTGDDIELDGLELPLEYRLINDNVAYVAIYSFFDNDLLTIELWERLMLELNANGINNLIIDMRSNGGGRGYLADQMAAYFFNEELPLGLGAYYDDDEGEFVVTEPEDAGTFFLPPEDLRYNGDIAVIVGPSCASACEFFSYNMTLQDRATIIGHYPTAGLGGGISEFEMPDDITVRFTISRGLDMDGNIHIEGIGVVPEVLVPLTEEAVFGDTDVLLQTALDELQ
ncbi:MAG: S41 family peptidase [Anaerolineae bacterium]